MKTARKPEWVKRREQELRDAGITADELAAVQAEYESHGINLARVHGKGWRLFAIHPEKAVTFTLWADLGGLVHDRADIIARYHANCASV